MLAGAAAERGGLSAGDMVDVRFAGFVHDLGTIGVSAGTWGQPSPLTETQRDQVHLHAYHSERIIGRVSHLAGIAVIVGGHHERADGSGYHRATPHPGPSTQLLAAADVYVALAADRPYRPRRSADEAASALRDEAQMGRLDSDVVARVIDAAHGTTTANKVLVTRLTDREIEVLRLLARGSRTK